MTEIEKLEIIRFISYLKSKVDDFYLAEVEGMIAIFFNKLNISCELNETKNISK